ncbi:MAG: type II toxin-antitoxin system VapC family toxin [Propionibacteriaceae bacterium]|nr:type II toxin-antitoxin system VapC family toxin [Propionibacteriaceae bacterium]
MLMPDVNILVGAWNSADPQHDGLKDWLNDALMSGDGLLISSLVMSGVMRLLTNPHVLSRPMATSDALDNIDRLLSAPRTSLVHPGVRHYEIFTDLCRQVNARGNLISDAQHAALAIEHKATWVTLDSDFAKFSGLRWVSPVAG